MSISHQAERSHALRDHLENISLKVECAAGALRAAQSLSLVDGSAMRNEHFAFLRQSDFSFLCDLILGQLNEAKQEIDATYEESKS